MMRVIAAMTVSLLGLLVSARAYASPSETTPGDPGGAIPPVPYVLPPHAVIEEIRFVGLHNIAAEAAQSQLTCHPGEEFDSTRIAADLHALNQLGWFEDVVVKLEESGRDSEAPLSYAHLSLEFDVREYPFLTGVEVSGSKALSKSQIKILLEDKKLSPRVGLPADPAKLHRLTVTIQSQLASMGYPEARVGIEEEMQSGGRVKVRFQVQDGLHLPVASVQFSGHPQVAAEDLRKHMYEIAPSAWFSSFRKKNILTPQKVEVDRVSLLAYLQNHGFPQARVGSPQTLHVEVKPGWHLPWRASQPKAGLSLVVPVEAGTFFNFGPIQVSDILQQGLRCGKKCDPRLSDAAPGHPFSQHGIESLQRDWEMRLHRGSHRGKESVDYRLRPLTSFDDSTHLAHVKFDFDPVPAYVVGRIDFRGNQRFPDRYLRRRIGVSEGHPFDEYALEAGLARVARTGYFQPLHKEDLQIEPHEDTRTTDVTIHFREKGRQRIAFSGGREQFGTTLGIAYTAFNLLGLDEFLSTHIDGGPETLQLGIGLAKEGFLGSRGTLALSLFDTFILPRFATSVRVPLLRSQSESMNLGWTYAVSDADAIGINYGLSRSVTKYVADPGFGASDLRVTNLRNANASHSVGVGWAHYAGDQKIQVTDSVSGGWLGGNENLVKSKVEYSHIFRDDVFDHHAAWAFRTTFIAAGSYKGDMPLYARFFSGDDLVRGLRPGELGPYETLGAIAPSAGTTYSTVRAGADLIAASNLEYRFPIRHGVEGAAFFDAGSGLLLPNWLGQTRPSLINSTNGLLHGSVGFEVRWTLPVVPAPLRANYSFNILRLNRALFMPDGTSVRMRNRLGVLGWGLGSLF